MFEIEALKEKFKQVVMGSPGLENKEESILQSTS